MESIVTTQNIVLLGFTLIGVLAISVLASKLRKLEMRFNALDNQYRSLQYEVNGFFDSGSAVGKRILNLEKRAARIEEEQQQFTLKEPTHQTYEHALRLLKDGQPLDEIVENSGLSRGELELLSLLRRVEDGESVNLS